MISASVERGLMKSFMQIGRVIMSRMVAVDVIETWTFSMR